MSDNKARAIFVELVSQTPPEQWDGRLAELAGEDQDLRAKVAALLAAHRQADSFLEHPAAALGGTVDVPRSSDEPAATSASERDTPAESAGMVLAGRYKLLEPIGEGGMGAVWKAQQIEPVKRLVAVKLIKPGMDSKQVLARFEAERQALALMDHPNIAKVHDAGKSPDGRPYFVMELVKGIPLTKYCDEHRLTPKERLELFVLVCQAIQHAHQKGIIHRDIKPSNVLVALYDGKPVPKVIDFGIAKATGQQLTEHTLVTGLGTVVGTLEYMSPEQAEHNQLDIDTRSDIYSLGVLLYELLTGTTPLDRKRLRKAAVLELLRLIREEEPPRPSTRLSDSKDSLPSISAQRHMEPAKLTKLVRGELDWIVMKALEKDRNRRYETANGFAQDVQRYLADEPVLACPPSAAYRFRKFVRRNRTALAVAGLILFFIAVVGGGGGWVMWDRAAREQEADQERWKRETALDGEVDHAADETGNWNEQGNWPESLAALERADKLLASAGRPDRPARLAKLQKDLDMGRRLEDISREPPRDLPTDLTRLRSGVGEGELPSPAREADFFWFRAQDAQFTRAFQQFDMDIDALGPAEAAERMGRTSIRKTLVEALDEWAALRRQAWGDSDARRHKLVAITQQVDPDKWRNLLRAASISGDRQALAKLADAIPLREVPPATLWQLGNELMGLGYPDRAMAVLRQAQHRYPDDYRINETLGWFSRTAFIPPHYDDALLFYTAAASLRPNSPRAHRALAEALLLDRSRRFILRQVVGTKGFEEAIAEYSRIIELTPDDARAWIDRGNVYLKAAQYEKAIADHSRAIERDPNNAWAHHCLAQTLWTRLKDDSPKAPPGQGKVQVDWSRVDQSRIEKIVAELRQAIRLKPEYEPAHALLCNALRLGGRLDEGIALYQEAIRLRPDEARYHFYLSDLLAAKAIPPKNWVWSAEATPGSRMNAVADKVWLEKAIAQLEEAVRIKKDWQWAYHCLERARVKMDRLGGEWDEARCREDLRLQPDDLWARIRLSDVLEQKGQWEEFIAERQKALRLRPDDNTIRLMLCFYLQVTGRLDEAIAEWREAMLREPNNVVFHFILGDTLYDKGRLDEAIAEYLKAIRLDPHEERAHKGLGRALIDKGRWDEAIAAYRALDRLRSNFPVASGQRKVGEEIRRVERLAQLDARLPAILAGKDQPRYAGERCDCAFLCARPYRRQYAAAARFYREAFAADPRLAEPDRYSFRDHVSDLTRSNRDAANLCAAARVAALASCGQGDAAGLDEKERARLRRQALDWLRADWVALSSSGDGGWHGFHVKWENPDQASTTLWSVTMGNSWVALRLEEWLGDSSFAGVRGPEALAKLPEGERQAWQKLWDDVTELRNQKLAKSRRLSKQEQEARVAACHQAIERNPKDPTAYLKMGRALLGRRDDGSWGEAVAYGKALELYPQAADAHLVVGQALLRKGITSGGTKDDLEAALTVCTKAIALAPTSAEAQHSRGQVYWRLGQPYEALLDLDMAIHLSPNYSAAFLQRAVFHQDLGQWDRSRADYSRYLDQQPGNSRAFCGRGQAHQKLGMWSEAVSDYRKAIELGRNYFDCEGLLAWLLVSCPEPKVQDPRWAVEYARNAVKSRPDLQLWLTLGVAEYRSGNWQAAVAALDKAREIEVRQHVLEGDHRPLFFLAMAHGRLGHNDEAQKWYKQAMRKVTANRSIEWYDEVRRFRLEAEEVLNVKKALGDFSRAIELEPKNASIRYNRGVAYRNLRQYDKAVADFSKALELDQKYFPAWYSRGFARSKLGQYDKAIADYSRAIELNSKHAGVHNELAWLLVTCPDANVRDPKRAIELAKKAVQLAPNNSYYWGTLGTAHYRAGDWKVAVAALDKSRSLKQGWDAYNWLFLAMAHRKLGNDDDSRKAHDQAIQWLNDNKPLLETNPERAEELRRFQSEAKATLDAKPAPPMDMDAVYQAMKLSALKVGAGPFKAGDVVRINYAIKNSLERELPVPVDKLDKQRFPGPVVGVRQHWLERLGDDANIPAIPAKTMRVGKRYAAGGFNVVAPLVLAPSQSLPCIGTIMTKGFPPGRYRFHVDYNSVNGKTLQSASVEFELVP